MTMCIQRSFMVFICIGLLAFHPNQVCGSRNLGLLIRRYADDQPKHHHHHHRVLKGVEMNNLNTDNNKQAPVDGSTDPNKSSKRKVRRGSDPIHNRTWHRNRVNLSTDRKSHKSGRSKMAEGPNIRWRWINDRISTASGFVEVCV